MIVASIWLAGKWLDHRKFSNFGLHLNRHWWMDLLFGLGLGAGLMGLVFLWEYRQGWVTVTGTFQTSVPGLALSLGLVFSITKDLCVGIYEEMVSRGYLLTNLAEGVNGVAGLSRRAAVGASMLLTSAIFGVLHAFNENSTVFSSANLAFIGIMFAVGYVATGELGLPIGLHMSWNFFQGTVFGLPVSGAKEGASILGIQQVGPALFTGGAFGPEAGLVGTAAATLGIVLIVAWARNRRRVPFALIPHVTSAD
jgi:membrane protease YdiL (CAAX protease family)